MLLVWGLDSTNDVHHYYNFHEQLGSGAYSTVYRATAKQSHKSARGRASMIGRDYAVKRVRKADVPSQEDIDALYEEVGILQVRLRRSLPPLV